MAKDVIVPAIIVLLLATFATAGALITGYLYVFVLAVFSWLLLGFLLYFFRDPQRLIPDEAGIIISPADGKIVSIEQVEESAFVGANTHKVSIFMSPLNVHVNRIPISGRISYLRYQPGKFLAAYKPDSSALNEQMLIGIEGRRLKILFKQIAGTLARRIVCSLKKDQTVEIGKRFGLIKFGSRLEIFMPLEVELRVKEGQRTVAGETILGAIRNGKKK